MKPQLKELKDNLAAMPRPWLNESPVIDWLVYQNALSRWAETPFAELREWGRSLEDDPLFEIRITDFEIPPDRKFHIAITAHHSGGERSALHAAMKLAEYMVSSAAAGYRKHVEIAIMPCGNPFGYFRQEGYSHPQNSAGIDPYTGRTPDYHWNVSELKFEGLEKCPEIAAFCKFMDDFQPEILLDFHGVGRTINGEIMIQYFGSAGSNHALTPWSGRLLDAMHRFIMNHGDTSAFPMEENIQRLHSTGEARQAFPFRFRRSGDMFYTDMYPYIKYHTMPIMMEIAYEEMAVNAIRGLLDYALNPPVDQNHSLPVDNIVTDFSGLSVCAWGTTPGEKRRSRCELWGQVEGIKTFCLTPRFTYHFAKLITLGRSGYKHAFGDKMPGPLGRYGISDFFDCKISNEDIDYDIIREFIALGPEKHISALDEIDLSSMPEHVTTEFGISFANDIQINPKFEVKMLDIRLNGIPLREDSRDGYQLIRTDHAYRLFIHVPPEKAIRLKFYFITAGYTADAPLKWGWQPAQNSQEYPDNQPNNT